MRAADADGVRTRVDGDGMHVATWETANGPTTSEVTQLPEVKSAFEAVLQAALVAINTRHTLKVELGDERTPSEP